MSQSNDPYPPDRPWGRYIVLSEAPNYKVKRIEVLPGKRTSLQSHTRRSEHWLVIEGEAEVTLDGATHRLKGGESIDLPVGAVHRMANPGEDLLVFIEIQQGDYFGEDDIKRYEDDFGRS